MNTGVYILYHTYNPSKLYIGSTRCLGFKQRFNNHIKALKKGIHNNKHLQSVCNKYGINGFIFKILQEYKPEFCLEAEQFWINYFNSYYDGYNQSKNPKGYSSSFEVKRNMTKNQQKVVLQINKSNNVVARFIGVIEASRKTGVHKTDISFCCNNVSNVKMAGGYLWCFEENYNSSIVYTSNYNNQGVLQYDKNSGEFIKEWSSIKDAANYYSKGHNGNITNCCRGKVRSVYNSIWKYK